ncbi:hypothetical protein Prudu_005664, partial [Prunus dulcis]
FDLFKVFFVIVMGQETRRLADEYEISEILGRGGFSVVRKGISRKSGSSDKNNVAIKTLKRPFGPSNPPPGRSGAGDHQKSFAAAFQARKQVSISNVLLTNEILVMRRIVENVSPHQMSLTSMMCMRMKMGSTLCWSFALGQERYSEAGAAAVVRQIAQGLAALHKSNIVHRDLKPENCLFLNNTDDSSLKIMDFGLSSVEEFTDPVVGLFGSIDYVSPEALSQGQVTSKSDMWALGVILYILLSGYVLLFIFLGTKQMTVTLVVPTFYCSVESAKATDDNGCKSYKRKYFFLQGEFSFYEKTWKGISLSAKQLISDLLKVDPDKRPSAQELLDHPWVVGLSAKEDQMDAEIVSRLQSFNARRKLRAAAIASVWTSSIFLRTKKLKSLLGSHDLKPDEIQKLSLHFKKICVKGDNATLSEFEEVLKAMNMSSLIPLAPRIFDLFDNNRDGTVDMREILCGFSSLKNSQGDDALRLCFQMYDTDRSGCISKEEVASMLRVMPLNSSHLALPDDCLPADITEPGKLDEIFDRMDANSDGQVTFDEFKAAMQRDSSLQDVVLSSLRPL